MDDGAVDTATGFPGHRSGSCVGTPSITASARAEYIVELCAELEMMARGAGETVLATLFRLARAEATRIATQAKTSGG